MRKTECERVNKEECRSEGKREREYVCVCVYVDVPAVSHSPRLMGFPSTITLAE